MSPTRSWREMQDEVAAMLLRDTGHTVEEWNRRIAEHDFDDEASLRRWLKTQGVEGYAQSKLVMERFGYPDFLTASSDELVKGQYADRPQLRPVFDAIIARLDEVGVTTVQTRKTYVSLVGPRRTYAAIHPKTRTRVDLGLRIDTQPEGRIVPAKNIGNGDFPVKISLEAAEQVDDEVIGWLRRTYDANR